MATKMLMPLLGQTMEEGTIIKWFKNEGDTVKAGEPLLEVLTDKVNMEVESPENGVLRKIIAPQDAIVPVKDPICIFGTADESIDSLLAEDVAVEEAAPAPAPAAAQPAPQTVAPAQTPAPAQTQPVADTGRLFASPAAKRVAKEKGIEISALAGRGTGPNGRIVEKDVLNFVASMPKGTPLAEKVAMDMGLNLASIIGTGIGGKITSSDVSFAAQPAEAAFAPAQIGGSIPFSGIRKAIAQNVASSAQTAPHVTLVSSVDMTECVKMRNQILAKIENKYGVRISYTDIIVKAAARAIIDNPIVNSTLTSDQIIIHDRINIGIATALDGALVVPVVKDIQAKTLPQVSAEIKTVVSRARTGQSLGDDMKGGTFSISNLGGYGVESFNPIIAPGQSAILGVCAITEKPVVVNGEIVVRSTMNLCLSFDHRVMDGAPAAEYLARVKEILESPYLIFM